jgi:MAPEG family.
VVSLSGQSSGVTAAAGWVYLGARVVYIPAYLLGWAPWRSAIWFVGWLATYTMLIAALI